MNTLQNILNTNESSYQVIRADELQHVNVLSEFLHNTLSKNTSRQNSTCMERHFLMVKNMHIPVNGKNKEGVFVAKINQELKGYSPVSNLEEFGSFVDQLKDIRIEKSYVGHDADFVTCYTATLPDDYFAMVPIIRLKHVPQHYFEEGNVRAQRYFDFNRKSETEYSRVILNCYKMAPIFSNASLGLHSAEEIKSNYHCVTFKIYNDSKTIKSWATGLDPDSQLIIGNNLLENWCSIGSRKQDSKNSPVMTSQGHKPKVKNFRSNPVDYKRNNSSKENAFINNTVLPKTLAVETEESSIGFIDIAENSGN